MKIDGTKKYYEWLEKLEEKIRFMDVKSANELLDQVFKIKPVRLKWYLLKAQVMLKEGKNIEEIVELLEGKCEPWYLYDDVDKYLALLSILAEVKGDSIESQRYLYQFNRIQEELSGQKEGGNHQEVEEELEDIRCRVLGTEVRRLDINRLAELYYVNGNLYLYMLWQVVSNSLFPKEKREIRESVLEKTNAEYYYERLTGYNGKDVFVVFSTDAGDEKDCRLAIKALGLLGIKAFYQKESKEKEPDEARGRFLEEIVNKHTETGFVMVLSSGVLMDRMAMKEEIKPHLERLTAAENDYSENRMAVGWYGDYLAHIANIYRTTPEKIKEELHKEPQCRFSVIIPCRGDSGTLYHTLKTCLNQSYKGKYEIIVSDNSDMSLGKETAVYQICQELSDERIKYYRVPRSLYLPKSFEFAFLKAEGEFLFSLGADDGLLPWCLKELDEVLERYPEKNIFLWHQAVYQWPEVREKWRMHFEMPPLLINSKYIQGSPDILEYSAEEVFLGSFYEYDNLCLLPQLYHGSGMRREYMADLYERTGRLWGGICQDICMGVTIGNIEKNLYFINNPLTIDGASEMSIGIMEVNGADTLRQRRGFGKQYKRTLSCGARAYGYLERLCPPVGGFWGNYYVCVMYAYAIGVISNDIMEQIDWKNIYEKSANDISKDDILCDQKLHRLRYAVSFHGEEMLKWFDDNFYYEKLNPEITKSDSISMSKSNNTSVFITVLDQQIEVRKDTISDIYKASLYLEKVLNTMR